MEFGLGQIGCPCCQFSWATALDQVSARYHSNMVGVFLLRPVVHNYPSVRDNTVTWDQRYFSVAHDKDRVCPFLSCFVVTLRHAAKFFSKRGHPCLCSGRVILQFF